MASLFTKPRGPSAEQLKAEHTAVRRNNELDAKLAKQTAAGTRRRRGRASLISGDERGISDTLGA
jgi:hypothetical protein